MKHYADQYYHVYNRGVNKLPIFINEGNYTFLLQRIKRYLPDNNLVFVAYCLMPNHYHFLIRVEEDDQLSPFLRRLFSSYTQAFNRQQNRSGTLFESRAKSKLVDEYRYVIHLARYIHLNPVKANLVNAPEDWPYSNYREWIGVRSGTLYAPEFVKANFFEPREYKKFVMSEISSDIENNVSRYYL
jgi:REP element-mobilizing transposase RayT